MRGIHPAIAALAIGASALISLVAGYAANRDPGPRFELLWTESGHVSVMDYNLTGDDCLIALVANPSPYLSCAIEESHHE